MLRYYCPRNNRSTAILEGCFLAGVLDITKIASGLFAYIPYWEYNSLMVWEVEYTCQFGDWWDELSEGQQDAVAARVALLAERGPHLPYPYCSDINGSRHGVMRELRAQAGGNPLRVLYAFDPRRAAILLIGGDKTGNDRFYEEYVPVADNLYDEHLEELREEGLI